MSGEVIETQDLVHSRLGHMGQRSKRSLAVDFALANHGIKSNRKAAISRDKRGMRPLGGGGGSGFGPIPMR